MLNYYTTILLLCLTTGVLSAQITLTSSSNFNIGDNYTYKFIDASNIITISVGADVTWDFSNVSEIATRASKVANPSTLVYGDLFTNANVGIIDLTSNNEAYYYLSNDIQQYYGAVTISPQGTGYIIYTDPQDFIRFPMTYGDEFTDTFSGTVETSVVFDRAGTAKVGAEAYGTLITPNGTFSNVLLLRTEMNYGDELDGNPVFSYIENRYSWYDAETNTPIMSYSLLEYLGTSIALLAYLDSYPLSTSSPLAEAIDLSVFPNPTADWISIDYTLAEKATVAISVSNLIGKEVMMIAKEVEQIGQHNLRADLGDLANGTYFVKMNIDDQIATYKVLVQR